jgi:hypothetical protein
VLIGLSRPADCPSSEGWVSNQCGNCSALRLIPRTTSKNTGHVGIPSLKKQITKSPPSFELDVDLGFPIAWFSANDLTNSKKLEAEKHHLRFCIDFDLRNLVFFRAKLPHFYWIAETKRSNKGPIPAFYYDEMPSAANYQKHIYSFIGPALIPLALRYKKDGRNDLLECLRGIFREMPSRTIPSEIQKVLPELFGDQVA